MGRKKHFRVFPGPGTHTSFPARVHLGSMFQEPTRQAFFYLTSGKENGPSTGWAVETVQPAQACPSRLPSGACGLHWPEKLPWRVEFDPKGTGTRFLETSPGGGVAQRLYTIHNILSWGSIYRCCFSVAQLSTL